MIDLFVIIFRTGYPKGWRLYDVMSSLILLFIPVLDHVFISADQCIFTCNSMDDKLSGEPAIFGVFIS